MIVVEDEAYKLLSPYFSKILQCVLEANKEQREGLSASARAKARKRTESTLMNDLVTHNLKSEFNGIPGITIKERYGQIQIWFACGSSGFKMKAKQSNAKKPISCISTQLAMGFLYQIEQLQLPGMPNPFTNIILSYEWNQARTEIAKVSIKCPQDIADYTWEIPITISGVSEFAKLTDESPIITPPANIEKRVTLKKKDTKRAKKVIRKRGNSEGKGEANKS